MNKAKFIKNVTAVVILSCGIVGASFADHSSTRDNHHASQSERFSSEITYSTGINTDRSLAERHGIVSNDRSRDSYSRNENQHGIQISIYQRDQYGSQSRRDSVLRSMSSSERQAVRFFQNHPYEQRLVKVDNRNRREIYYRSDYPQWLLRS